ncbi:MAG: rod shape-determining protein MreD [Candidatus Moranbacteria bacterium RIFOXYA12_FULL_44_15]|nr:MAG: rod shape-determining protein MreD [Candidatus Moranbacteria bacterium RIFOXYA12_FULL_44_15]OGI36428.1 MAG: rod shape-determining protein MreD [Candidatus Moranbacteria bacterium RIFOXYA2_FULL_43_15]
MIQKAVIFIFIFLAAIIQFSLFPALFPLGICPDLLLMSVIFWALRNGFEKTAARAVLAGFLADLFHFQPVGTDILLFSLAAFGASSLAKRFLVSHRAWGFFFTSGVVAAGTIAYAVSSNFVGNVFHFGGEYGQAINSGYIPDWSIALKVIFNLAVFALVSRPLEKIEKTFELYGQRMPGFRK